MTQQPVVSIVTPSYNQAEFLETAMLSVLNQDYPNIEYIVIDGGSSDGSPDIIQRYANRLAYWVSEPDHGQADALLKGFARATGEILAYLNSDDVYLPGAVTAAVSVLERDPDLALVHGDCIYIDSKGRRVGRRDGLDGDFLGFFLQQRNPIQQPSAFWRKSAVEVAGPINRRLHLVMDYDLWCRIGLRGLDIKHIAEPLSKFRIHDESKSKRNRLQFAQEHRRLFEEYLEDPELGPLLKPFAHRIRAMAHLRLADAYWILHENTAACAHYRQMLRLAPSCVFSKVGRSLTMRIILRRHATVRPRIIDQV
jgi:glycosyltransferase involved in cell wall biosynthesis